MYTFHKDLVIIVASHKSSPCTESWSLSLGGGGHCEDPSRSSAAGRRCCYCCCNLGPAATCWSCCSWQQPTRTSPHPLIPTRGEEGDAAAAAPPNSAQHCGTTPWPTLLLSEPALQ